MIGIFFILGIIAFVFVCLIMIGVEMGKGITYYFLSEEEQKAHDYNKWMDTFNETYWPDLAELKAIEKMDAKSRETWVQCGIWDVMVANAAVSYNEEALIKEEKQIALEERKLKLEERKARLANGGQTGAGRAKSHSALSAYSDEDDN